MQKILDICVREIKHGLINHFLSDSCFVFSIFTTADRAFEAEINCSNPLGTGGRLAIGFAVLLRALWKGTHHAFQPSKLKVSQGLRETRSLSLCF